MIVRNFALNNTGKYCILSKGWACFAFPLLIAATVKMILTYIVPFCVQERKQKLKLEILSNFILIFSF